MSASRFSLLLALMVVAIGQLPAQQEYRDDFDASFRAERWTDAERTLAQWAESHPSDPELFVARFNFFRATAQQMGVEFADRPGGEIGMELTDSETGAVVGFMNLSTAYDPNRAARALTAIIEGVDLYPQRLDMRLGMAYFQMEIGDFQGQAATLRQILTVQDELVWTWTGNEPLADASDVIIGSLQNQLQRLFANGTEPALRAINSVGAAQVEAFPSHVFGYTNLATTHAMLGEIEAAMQWFAAAESVAPNDCLLLMNIAFFNRTITRPEVAIGYYERVIESCDERFADAARRELERLESQ